MYPSWVSEFSVRDGFGLLEYPANLTDTLPRYPMNLGEDSILQCPLPSPPHRPSLRLLGHSCIFDESIYPCCPHVGKLVVHRYNPLSDFCRLFNKSVIQNLAVHSDYQPFLLTVDFSVRFPQGVPTIKTCFAVRQSKLNPPLPPCQPLQQGCEIQRHNFLSRSYMA